MLGDDHFDGVEAHLNGRGITLVCESIAPLPEILEYKRQMGYRFPWLSSLGSDFRYDFGAAFTGEQDGLELPRAWWRRHDEYR